MEKINKKFIITLKVILIVSIFFYLYRNNNIDLTFINGLKSNSLLNILLFAIILSTLILGSLRWLIILRNLKININFFEVFKIIYICSFFNNFMFGNFGGDVLRIFYAIKISKKDKIKNGFTVFVDRVFGLIGLLTLGFTSFIIILLNSSQYKLIFYIFCLIFLSIFISFLVIPFLKKNEKIKLLIQFFGLSKKLIFFGIAVSIILFFTVHLTIFIISSKIFLFDININNIFFANFISSLAGAVPLTPGGIGLSEASFVFINNNILKIYLENLANIIIYYRLLIFIFSLPSLYYFFSYKRRLI